MVKIIAIISGTILLGIGIIGIFLPGLPTTPFLLLSAGLYARSSDKLYQRIITNNYIGPRIIEYQRNKGLKKHEKVSAILFMWFMIFVSAFVFMHTLIPRLIIIAVGLIGTLVMGFILPTVK
jgi:uncharacterized membrane protein YbaN (DUF454 family)